MISGISSLGQTAATTGVINILDEVEIYKFLNCHATGDWGDLYGEDKKINELALPSGEGRYNKPYKYSPEHIGKAMSAKRLGDICYFNVSGTGETLIQPEVVDITRELLKEGHYVWIVTNGTLTKHFNQFASFPNEYKKRLAFKMSFQYLELSRTAQIDISFIQ